MKLQSKFRQYLCLSEGLLHFLKMTKFGDWASVAPVNCSCYHAQGSYKEPDQGSTPCSPPAELQGLW